MDQLTARVDLSAQRYHLEDISWSLRKALLGGRGLNNFYLFHETRESLDPLSGDNPLIIGAGLLSGLPCPSPSRCSVSGKSPETELLGDTNFGGNFAPALRKTGLDHVIVSGQSERPVCLYLHEKDISFHAADHLWGLDCQQTQAVLKTEFGTDVQVLCIGQAGENLVRFACLRHGHKSAAGRGGLGCLMGSKRLKAIVVQGGQAPQVKYPQALQQYTQKLNQRLAGSRTREVLHSLGTPFLFDLHNFQGIVRSYNGMASKFPAGKAIRAKNFQKYYTKARACFRCVIGCRHEYRLEADGQIIQGVGPEYGTVGAFGPICGLNDPKAILLMNDRVNRYGLDSVSTGNIIAWSIELFQKGLITTEDTDGVELNWGDADTILKLVDDIAFQRGFGSLLALGALGAGRWLGRGTEEYLVWTKNLIQSDSVDVRAHKGFALGVATSTRGADHLRSRPTLEALRLPAAELAQIYSQTVSSDPHSYEGKAVMVWQSEIEYALGDALGICRFAQRFNSPDHLNFKELSHIILSATGLELSEADLQNIGERILSLERLFLGREGLDRKADSLPGRYFIPMEEGSFQGECIDQVKFDHMLDQYYTLHGWDPSTGLPSQRVLQEIFNLR